MMNTNQSKQLGLTLIELLIAVAIVGVLAAIAVPSYQRYVVKAHRVDAVNALMRISAEQEKYYLDNNTYFDNDYICKQNWFPSCPTTDNGYYTLRITGANLLQTFEATATPITGRGQDKDKQCTQLSIDGSGQRKASGTNKEACWR